jgi:hypothetical protein
MVVINLLSVFLQRDHPPGTDPVGDIDQRYNSQVAGLESSWVGENGSGETGDELGSSRPYPLHHKPPGNISFLFGCEWDSRMEIMIDFQA